ncbi:MAG: dodecin domain-containing protein [Burkholderiales bacterium]|nr:dodecin domain-containing protein [Burkholderiales bacterium]MDE2286903.1 dodecin domain-containing protein [Burkholderiales bacterium]MDE2609584.1 dodecin domain-containing protein [Burkholderiales bacterium]TAL54356.1 MAG: dodecin domain-containing protein [Pandoraea sp.]TAM17406.1 MAG: dodecin domain-containing protein [Pandoraea sp.]
MHAQSKEVVMSQIVKVVEIMTESPKSWEDAAQKAVDKASKSLRGIRSLYIQDMSAEVDKGKIVNYRINAKVTFKLE